MLALHHVQHRGHGLRNKALPHRHQIHIGDARREGRRNRLGDNYRKPRLPNTTRTDQRHQPGLA
jgi:hypothetical protein